MILVDPDGKQVDFRFWINAAVDYSVAVATKDLREENRQRILNDPERITKEGPETGAIESAEIQPADFIGGAIGTKLAGGLFKASTGLFGEGVSGFEKTLLKLSDHAMDKVEKEGITQVMINNTLSKGSIFSGEKSGALSYVLKNAYSEGHGVTVGVNTTKKIVTTVIRSRNKSIMRSYYKPIENSLETLKIIK